MFENNPLYDATKILAKEGWTRGVLKDPEGYCAVGALAKALGASEYYLEDTDRAISYINEHNQKAYKAVLELLNEEYEQIGSTLYGYNDRAGREKSDIIALLMTAALRYERLK